MAEVHVTLTNATNSIITHGTTVVFHSPGQHPLPTGTGQVVGKSTGKNGLAISGQIAGTAVVINNPA